MPPSVIPPAQLRAMMADMQASGDYRPQPPTSAEAAPVIAPRRGSRLGASGLILVGVVFGVAVAAVSPVAQLFKAGPAAIDTAPRMMVLTPTPIQSANTTSTSAPAQAPAPVPTAAQPQPSIAALEPSLRPSHYVATVPSQAAPAVTPVSAGKPCLAGGPCTKNDVNSAERRLRNAYAAADRAGVSSQNLASVKQRWNGLRAHASVRPRTTTGGYRKLAAELNSRTTARHHR